MGYYRKYSDGFIEQWGNALHSEQVIKLPQKFKNSSYIVLATPNAEVVRYSPVVIEKTTTQFKLISDVEPASWLAYGFYK